MFDPAEGGDKLCRDCGLIKPLTDFSPDKKRRDGRTSYCRSCFRLRHLESYRKRRAASGRPVVDRRIVPDGQKWCPDCQAFKGLDEFPKNRADPLGRGGYCKPCHNIRGRENRIKNHGSTREYHLRRRYGIGQIEVDKMLADQGGVCAVCEKPNPEHVDHDHKTGEVRGMLCFNCNQALGNVRDDLRVLNRLTDYLFRARGVVHGVTSENYRLSKDVIVEVSPECLRHHAA